MIEYTSRALRDLNGFDAQVRGRLFRATEALRFDPHPPASKRLKGTAVIVEVEVILTRHSRTPSPKTGIVQV